MADYIPPGDSAFNVWEQNIVAYAAANASAYTAATPARSFAAGEGRELIPNARTR